MIDRKSVVIVGANFAGLSAASRLQSRSRRPALNLDVCVIDRKADFVWTPNIHEILSGTKHPRDVKLSNRKITTRLGHRFLNDEVTDIDLDEKVIELSNNAPLAYDACLIACGDECRCRPTTSRPWLPSQRRSRRGLSPHRSTGRRR